ncbi:DNA-directed RNA polymerases I and III subunit RPAC1 [Balamuthia mandrillaris]
MSSGRSSLPSHLQQQASRVMCGPASVSYTSSVKTSGAFRSMAVDNTFDLQQFTEVMKIKIQSYDRKEGMLVFDLIGVDAPIANAFRRILIAEVPTMAIENVYIRNNTSIIQDEVLAHRLGLIPIKVDPRLFQFKAPEDDPTDDNTIVFQLKVRCSKAPGGENFQDPEKRYINAKVFSRDLIWEPQGEQEEIFAENPIAPVQDDILIAKLRPGQEIDVELHCTKGIGREHAKWSPVSTASYRLMPDIQLMNDITDEKADELVAKCPMGVFDIEDLGGGERRAVVSKPRNCTVCRECIREEEWSKQVKVMRVRDHFIFSVESTGILPPDVLVKEAITVLISKCQTLIAELDKLQSVDK